MNLFTVSPFEFFVLHTRTRFPFRYGIASMTEVPHLFVRTRIAAGGRQSPGMAAEGLPPKWFTKDPNTTFEQDLPGMLEVIRHAAHVAAEVGHQPLSVFDLWQELCRQQNCFAEARGFAPLLAHLGVSLIERAVLDGLCRALDCPLHRMVAENRLGIRLGEVYAALAGTEPREFLPGEPLPALHVRHTVGLGDPLSPDEIPAAERVDDGLPQDLESSIRAYGLRYFKIKLFGNAERDLPRLQALSRVLARETDGAFFVTLDGNENFKDFENFRGFWEQCRRDKAARSILARALVVEQPVHRDRALNDDTSSALRAWDARPRFIIDESDGAVGDLPLALELGYAGTSHKNCKGIIKGIANSCLLEQRRRSGQSVVLTGEDLCNLGPVALLQDLAMMALLGIEHVERNGHHYYRGLSMFPSEWQEAVLANHHDLYTRHRLGFARVHIVGGQVSVASLNAAPFGLGPLLDPSQFGPLGAT